MKIIRNLARIPLWFWLSVYGGFMYLQYFNWQNDSLEPLKEQIQTQKAAVANQRKQNQAAETFAQERETRFQELQSKAAEYQSAVEKLPRAADIPGVLTALADISDKVGAEITSFQPGKAEVKEFLVETPFKVALHGTFLQVMSFLDEIAHLKRIVASTGVSLKDPVLKGHDSMLNAEATIVTYHFDENARGSTVPTDDAANGKKPAPVKNPVNNINASSTSPAPNVPAAVPTANAPNPESQTSSAGAAK